MTTWAQTFGIDPSAADSTQGQDFADSVAAMPDGGVVVMGRLSIPNLSNDGHPKNHDAIVRYGASGAILWKKALTSTITGFDSEGGYGSSLGFGKILSDAAGNIFILSSMSMPGGGEAHPYVARLDQNGNLIWQQNLKVPSTPDPYSGNTTYLNSPFFSAHFTSTGKIVAGGFLYGGPASQPFITVFNGTTGAVELLKVYGYPQGGVQYQTAFAACGSRDGDQYVFGTNAGAGDPTSSLLLVNAKGAILAEKKLTTNDGFLFSSCRPRIVVT